MNAFVRLLPLFALCVLAIRSSIAAPPAAAKAGGPYSREAARKEFRRPEGIPFPADNRYTRPRAELGKALFFDPRLSATGTIACASCHRPQFSWTDSTPTSIGVPGTPLARRSPTILNLAWGEALFWDGRAGSLEEQAVGPIQADQEMNMPMDKLIHLLKAIPAYARLFEQAYPNEPVSSATIGKAIATFERTVVSGISPFDEWIMGDESAISESAKTGFDLFNDKARCVKCHSGWNFTDDSFHDLGFEAQDRGRGKLLPQIEAAQFAFKTPTLRNVDQRAPYFHDGSLRTLEDVIEHYDSGKWIKRPSLSEELRKLDLTDAEKRSLVDFMKTLTGTDEPIALPVLPN
jgi:cytochrome c peroxidase